MSDPQSQKPKIIVDEDWKAQVQAEKEIADEKRVEKRAGREGEPAERLPLPAATLSFLVTTLATQAMVSLGQITNPISGNAEPNLPQAKHFIDTLIMLQEKTAGNRTAEESAILEGILHELRLAYIEIRSHWSEPK